MKSTSGDKIDRYYGILYDSHTESYWMGGTPIEILKNSNINAKGEIFQSTKGLWSLIMLKTPPKIYTHNDMESYRRLVKRTDVLNNPNNILAGSRPTTTWKWKNVLSKFTAKAGQGIEFLPSDIKGLQSKFTYLLGEFQAGNTSVTLRNKIVAISDELLRRNAISRQEYQRVNDHIQQE